MPTEKILLQAHDVVYAYGNSAVVNGVTLTLHGGEIVMVVGPNGCGKSTLLRVLCGQARPRMGRVTVGGVDVRNMSPGALARQLALVPQNASVGFAYSVRQMVLMARWSVHTAGRGALATTLGFETHEDHRIADEAMWILDVHHLADRAFTTLSGGECQRVIIARALAQHTPGLLLDEPTSALDLWHQLELLEHLRKLAKEEGKAILLITHDLNLALQYADRVVVMDAGRVVAQGTPGEALRPEVLEPVYRVKMRVGDSRVLTFAKRDV